MERPMYVDPHDSFPHNVLLNAKSASSAGKRTCPNNPQFNMAVQITLEHTYAQNARDRIRAVRIIWLLHTEVVWHTNQSLHAIWCSPMRPHTEWPCVVGIGCVIAFEHWVWANEMSIFLYVEVTAFTHIRKSHTHTNFTSEWFRNCICMSPSAAEISLQMSRTWDLNESDSPLGMVSLFLCDGAYSTRTART